MTTRILFYSPMSLKDGAGFQEWLERTLTTLPDNYQKTVLYGTLGDRGRWSAEEVERRFAKIATLKQVSYSVFWGTWCLPNLLQLFGLYRFFCAQDVVYFNHSFRLHDPLPKLLAKLAGAKIILGFHSPYQKTFWRKAYYKLFSFAGLPFVNACHAINSNSADFIKKSGARAVFLVPNFLLKKQLPSAPHAKYSGEYIVVGRNERQKGLDLLAPAVSKILTEFPKIKFEFFGTGPTRQIIKRLAKKHPDNVFDRGYEIDKDKIFCGRKFLILASRQEPFGLVIIEAMAYGIPVIASRVDGPLDIIEEGKEGWFIKELSAEGIVRVLRFSLELGKDDYQTASSNAFKKARIRYTEERFLPAFQKMLNSALL